MRTHGEIKELLGAFALDAVAPDERRALEAHLASCDECTREVAAHRESVSRIAPEEPVPSRVCERIEASLDAPEALVVPLRPRRRWAAALSAAAVAALAFLTWRVADLDTRLDRLGNDGVIAAADAALTNPDAERLVLRSEKGTLAVDIVLLPDGSGYVVQDNLDPLPEGRAYQLWALVGEQPVSAGVMGPDPQAVPFRVGPGTTGLAITVERAAGAGAPTGDPIAYGAVTIS